MIQSTFGDQNKYPSNRCTFFWLFALSIVLSPLAYISHLCNRFVPTVSDYLYLSAFYGIVMLIVGGLLCATGLSELTKHGIMELHWYHALSKLTKIGICYFGAFPALALAVIVLGIIFAAVVGVIWLGYHAGTFLWGVAGWSLDKTDDRLVSGYFKDLKKTHCTQIEYVRKEWNPAPVNSQPHELDNQ